MKRARHIPAKTIEKREIIASRNAERLSGGIALTLLRQKAAKERAALPTAEGLRPFRQRGRKGRSVIIPEPFGRIGEAEFAMLVLRELADNPPIPPDIEDAHRHGLRPSFGSGGGVMSNEQPRAFKTWSVLPI